MLRQLSLLHFKRRLGALPAAAVRHARLATASAATIKPITGRATPQGTKAFVEHWNTPSVIVPSAEWTLSRVAFGGDRLTVGWNHRRQMLRRAVQQQGVNVVEIDLDDLIARNHDQSTVDPHSGERGWEAQALRRLFAAHPSQVYDSPASTPEALLDADGNVPVMAKSGIAREGVVVVGRLGVGGANGWLASRHGLRLAATDPRHDLDAGPPAGVEMGGIAESAASVEGRVRRALDLLGLEALDLLLLELPPRLPAIPTLDSELQTAMQALQAQVDAGAAQRFAVGTRAWTLDAAAAAAASAAPAPGPFDPVDDAVEIVDLPRVLTAAEGCEGLAALRFHACVLDAPASLTASAADAASGKALSAADYAGQLGLLRLGAQPFVARRAGRSLALTQSDDPAAPKQHDQDMMTLTNALNHWLNIAIHLETKYDDEVAAAVEEELDQVWEAHTRRIDRLKEEVRAEMEREQRQAEEGQREVVEAEVVSADSEEPGDGASGEDELALRIMRFRGYGQSPVEVERPRPPPHRAVAGARVVAADLPAIDSLVPFQTMAATAMHPGLERAQAVVGRTDVGAEWAAAYKQVMHGLQVALTGLLLVQHREQFAQVAAVLRRHLPALAAIEDANGVLAEPTKEEDGAGESETRLLRLHDALLRLALLGPVDVACSESVVLFGDPETESGTVDPSAMHAMTKEVMQGATPTPGNAMAPTGTTTELHGSNPTSAPSRALLGPEDLELPGVRWSDVLAVLEAGQLAAEIRHIAFPPREYDEDYDDELLGGPGLEADATRLRQEAQRAAGVAETLVQMHPVAASLAQEDRVRQQRAVEERQAEAERTAVEPVRG